MESTRYVKLGNLSAITRSTSLAAACQARFNPAATLIPYILSLSHHSSSHLISLLEPPSPVEHFSVSSVQFGGVLAYSLCQISARAGVLQTDSHLLT